MTTTRAPFLAQSYGAYDHRDVPPEDAPLTHTGPGTPCGEYMRRFWQPVIFSDDLKDLPISLKILGEELVAFRDKSGNVGLMELHCPHRGTSLEFGILCDHGIRCCYHGWQMDVDGKILDTPGEPPDSTLKDRLYQGAYPVHEYNGIVFAYMGPPDLMPPFPMFDSYSRPGFRMIPGRKYFYPCNWLQILENAMDPTHTAFLHTIVAGSQFTDEFGVLPELDYAETPVGMVYTAARRVSENVWVRMVETVLPNLQQVAPIWETGQHPHGFGGPMMSRWIVPIDDTNTMFIEFRHIAESEDAVPPTPPWWGDRDVMLPAQLPDENETYTDRQHRPGDYDAQVTQRPIAVHGLEHLGVTDRGIIMFRRRLRKGIEATAQGQDPEGISRENHHITTYCNDSVVPIPEASDPEAETRQLQETARDLVQEYLARGKS